MIKNIKNHPCANPQCQTCNGSGIIDTAWLDWYNDVEYQDCPECIESANHKPHYGELGHGE